MQEVNFDNITVEQFLSTAEYIMLANPEMDGMELTDSEGRIWFLQLLSSEEKILN